MKWNCWRSRTWGVKGKTELFKLLKLEQDMHLWDESAGEYWQSKLGSSSSVAHAGRGDSDSLKDSFALSHKWHYAPLRGLCAAFSPKHVQEQTRHIHLSENKTTGTWTGGRPVWLFYKAVRPLEKYSSALAPLDMNARLDLVTFRLLFHQKLVFASRELHQNLIELWVFVYSLVVMTVIFSGTIVASTGLI